MSAVPYVISCAALALALAGCDAGQSKSEALGTEGGVVSLQSGLELSVPAGALQQKTQITLREHRSGDVTEIVLEPEGLELQQEATLGWSDDDGTSECERGSGARLEVRRNGQRAQIQIQRFERLRVRTRARTCDGGNSCEDRCGQGACDSGGGHGQGGEGCTGEGSDDGCVADGGQHHGEGAGDGDGECNDGGFGPGPGSCGDGDGECNDGGFGPHDGGGGGGPGPGPGSCGDGSCP